MLIYFFILAISITSGINLLLSPICLFLTYAIFCEEIKSGRTSLDYFERAFDIIFRSTLNQETVLQFSMNLLSLFFYNLTACLNLFRLHLPHKVLLDL